MTLHVSLEMARGLSERIKDSGLKELFFRIVLIIIEVSSWYSTRNGACLQVPRNVLQRESRYDGSDQDRGSPLARRHDPGRNGDHLRRRRRERRRHQQRGRLGRGRPCGHHAGWRPLNKPAFCKPTPFTANEIPWPWIYYLPSSAISLSFFVFPP